MPKLIYIDVETTGLYPSKHGIWQLAGCVEIDGSVENEFNYLMAPFSTDSCDPKALKINNITEDKVRALEHPEIAQERFTGLLESYINKFNKLDKFTFIGYNAVKFDDPFLRSWFRKCKDRYYGSYFHWPPIDVAVLAAWDLGSARALMSNFKLKTVAEEYLGTVDEEKLHDANYDIYLTREVFKKINLNNPRQS